MLKAAIEAIGLDYPTQSEKLKSKSWAVVRLIPATGADGKTYMMTTVDVRTFLMLLATIDEGRARRNCSFSGARRRSFPLPAR